jgi:mono/diheme cytochrome c family protein
MKLSMVLLLCWGAAWVAGGCSRPEAAGVSGNALAAGEEIYNLNCAMCHLDGKGGDLNPPLIGSSVVAGTDPTILVRIILHGQKGPIVVAGRSYDGIMPAQDFLTDEEVAAVSTYVRAAFGKKKDKVSPELVARERAAKP